MEINNIQPQTAWLFDVDGVLTDPEKKQVVLPELFDELIKRLKNDEPIGLNTGRSLDFMVNEVLNPIEKMVNDNRILNYLFAIGEKGGAWIEYNDGKKIVEIDSEVTVPRDIQNKIRELVNKPEYSKTMFFDETKQTIITVELKHGKTIEDFKEPQRQFALELEGILKENSLESEYRVDSTRIAIDVENRKMGKAYGARKFVELLDKNGIKPIEYICFGDSNSDYDMYEELKYLEKKVKFIFVGGEEHLIRKDVRDVVFTKNLVDRGTLDYLQDK